MRKRYKEAAGGFTLLEVMVALAVISISLVVLLSAQNAAVARSVHAGRLSRAALIGQKIAAETDLSELKEGEWEGEEEAGEMRFVWKKKVEPSVAEGVLKISVRVGWEGDEDAFLLETFRAV